MLPFVPNGRQNMISWLGARSDVPEYGKSLNFIFSKSTTVFGPSQVEADDQPGSRDLARSARSGASRALR